MSIAALVRGMAAAGAPPEAIALAVEAIETAQGQVDQKRAVERDRKRRQRERSRDMSQDNTGTVPGLSRDEDGTVPDASPAPSPSLPPDPQPNPTHTPVRNTRACEAPVLPDGVSQEQWAGFVEMRKRIKKPLTPRGQELILGKLRRMADDGQPPGDVLDQSTMNNWQGLIPIKDGRNGQRSYTNGQSGGHHPLGRTGAASDRAFGLDS